MNKRESVCVHYAHWVKHCYEKIQNYINQRFSILNNVVKDPELFCRPGVGLSIICWVNDNWNLSKNSFAKIA